MNALTLATIIAALLVVALMVARVMGVLRRDSIAGPDRLAPGEPVGVLGAIAGGGILAWLLVSIILGGIIAMRHQLKAPAPGSAHTLSTMAIVTVDLIARAVAVGLMLFLTVRVRPDFRRLGWTLDRLIAGVPRALAGAVILLPLMFMAFIGTNALLRALHIDPNQMHDLLKMYRDSNSRLARTLIIVSAVIAAPVSEELVFRGYLQTLFVGLLRKYARVGVAVESAPVGQDVQPAPAPQTLSYFADPLPLALPDAVWARWAGVILASLLFAAIHPWWSGLPIFTLALVLGYAYERTGNLWVPIFIHALFNATEIIIFLKTTG